MDLGPHALGRPPCPVETSEATRARRAARKAKRRKAAQSGEGIVQAPTTISTSEQKTIEQQYAVIFDQESPGQTKARTQKEKPSENSKEKLRKAKAQLQERIREHKNLLVTSETVRDELQTVKEQLGKTIKQNKMLTEERDQVMREVEDLLMNRDDLELENISTTSFQGTMADLKHKIKKLEKSLETANSKIMSGETTIMILEEENEELAVQVEKMKKMASPNLPKDISKDQTLVDGDALVVAEEQIKVLTEERDKARREVEKLEMEKDELENFPTTSFQASLTDLKCDIKKLEEKLEAANNEIVSGESTILVLEGEKEKLADELEEMKKEKKNMSSNLQKVTRENGDSLEHLQELYSEVRSIAGVSEDVSPEDSVVKLREAWHKHESRYQKLRNRVDGITERKRAAYANSQLLRESIERLLEVEPGTLEITDLVDKIEDIDEYYALKIDNINAKLVAKQQSSKDKLLNIRDICRVTATDMDIKFKKKTKIPEFLALYSSQWNKLQGLVTSLDKKLLERECRIEELESALDQMKEELEQTTTSKEIKKKKKRLLKTIINTMVPKQSADEKLLKIKDQADQIRRLEAIQESKYRQDHEVIALHREGNAVRQTLDDLQKRQKEQDDIIIDLNQRLDQEKEIVKELQEIIQILEARNPPPSQGEVLQHNMTQHMHNEQ